MGTFDAGDSLKGMSNPLEFPVLSHDLAVLAKGVMNGDRRALAKAITLVESALLSDRASGQALLAALRSPAHETLRIGITGTPGVGKSSFIEGFGHRLITEGHRLGILAIDPSSPISGGAILGDKTRMESLARDPGVYIRPSASGGSYGGVGRRTGEAVMLLEAAGFDRVVIETVGVGQNEGRVAGMVDCFLLLIAPAGGDELQGIKRGVMELADIVIVTKADGNLQAAAQRTVADYRAALSLMRPKEAGWRPPVIAVSNATRDGYDELSQALAQHEIHMKESGAWSLRRETQTVAAFWQALQDEIIDRLRTDPVIAANLPSLEQRLRLGELSPGAAVDWILTRFYGKKGKNKNINKNS